jgi:DNA-binding CsgD family transcriptional regulator
MALGLSVAVLVAATLSETDRLGRSVAALSVATAWCAARRECVHRKVPALAATELVGWAGLTAVAFAADGHAQSNAFLAMAPLGAIAAFYCDRRQMLLFAATWILAYLLGVAVGGGPRALLAHRQFDAAEQVLTMTVCCGVFFAMAARVKAYSTELEGHVRAAVDEHVRTLPPADPLCDAGSHQDRESRKPLLTSLSPTEKEVLRLNTEDKRTAEIAGLLYMATRTVEGHRSSIISKLKARSMPEAVAIYVECDDE